MNFGIIAAGEGSRLIQEGVAIPKPLVEINHKPMIRRLIDIFIDCGAESISIIINNEMTEVREYLEKIIPELHCKFHLVIKSTPSSMHSFSELATLMDGKFIVTTVDTIFRPADFKRYVEAFRKQPEKTYDGMMGVTSFIDDEKPLYVGTDSDWIITGFYDSPQEGCKFVSGGIYGLTPRCLPIMKDALEKGISRMRNFQRALIDNGLRLQAYDIGKIIDVDHVADISTAERFLSEE